MIRCRSSLAQIAFAASLSAACHGGAPNAAQNPGSVSSSTASAARASTDSNGECTAGTLPSRKALVTNIFTADPSAHVFGDTLYVYPSHDLEHNPAPNNNGDHYAMKDYHVLSFDHAACPKAIDHGEALNVKDVPWASQQMWAPDAAFKNGTYFLYFPARDTSGVFRIGVAKSTSPVGPFSAEPQPIAGSFSIDPASLREALGGHDQLRRRGERTQHRRRREETARTGRQSATFFRRCVDAQVQRRLLPVVLDRRYSLPRVCHRPHTERSLRLPGPAADARGWLDDAPLDRGVQRQVVPLLP